MPYATGLGNVRGRALWTRGPRHPHLALQRDELGRQPAHWRDVAQWTAPGTFGEFYTGLCFLGWVFVVCCFPETAGLSLEEVKLVFRKGFEIKKSQRLREQKREAREREKERSDLALAEGS